MRPPHFALGLDGRCALPPSSATRGLPPATPSLSLSAMPCVSLEPAHLCIHLCKPSPVQSLPRCLGIGGKCCQRAAADHAPPCVASSAAGLCDSPPAWGTTVGWRRLELQACQRHKEAHLAACKRCGLLPSLPLAGASCRHARHWCVFLSSLCDASVQPAQLPMPLSCITPATLLPLCLAASPGLLQAGFTQGREAAQGRHSRYIRLLLSTGKLSVISAAG